MAGLAVNRRSALMVSIGALAIDVARPAFSATAFADADISVPLGIGLEGWPYPGPVSFLPLVMGGQPVRMAFMDFAPTTSANGRAILLLHGKNFDSSYWAGPIEWLKDAGFRVIVPDQIGFNKSSKPDVDYSFEALSKNTIELANALSLKQVVVLGHSTGGALAVRLANMYPERVTHLILEDPISLIDYRAYIPPQDTKTLVEAEHAYTTETYRAFIAHFFPLLAPSAYEPFVTWRMRTTCSGEFDRFAKASALTYQMIYREPVRSLYGSLPMPVLLTAGTNDRSAPLVNYATAEARARMPGIHEAAQQAVADLRQGRFVSFPEVGHVPHLEMPERFKLETLSFLKS